MTDFSYLKTLDVTANITARYTITSITLDGESNPVLIVKPATEANKPFANEQLKMTRRNANAYRSGAVNIQMVEDTRENDRKLFAKYVVVGWENVVDSEGMAVKYSPDEALSLLEALPDWIFDELRSFCGNPTNFVDTVNVEAITKNL